MRFHLYVLSMTVWLGFLASSCQDSCRQLECDNGGYCHEGECVCPKWYSGKTCQLQFNRNYEGTYRGSFSDHERSFAKEIAVEADPLIPNRLNLPSGVYLEFETDSTLLIPLQSVVEDNDTVIVLGQGSFKMSVLQYKYEVQNDAPDGLQPTGTSFSFSGERIEE